MAIFTSIQDVEKLYYAYLFKVHPSNFRHLSVIDQKFIGVVSTETEI
jgi:hypothetical protein